jgi:hypothetical protein
MSSYDHWKTTNPDAEAPDPLEGKPSGFCPWCDGQLLLEHDDNLVDLMCLSCAKYDGSMTETENRIRYAAQRLEESKLWNKIEKQGGER